MNLYSIRKATKDDVDKIVEIYNSNKEFLVNHLGVECVDYSFISSEMNEMEVAGFLSTVIIDKARHEIIGVLDYKPESSAYLSLLMIHSKFHGKGMGTLMYKCFEKDILRAQKQRIRIDVVNDYENNLVGFWRQQDFISQKEIELEWGNKKSNALAMMKSLE